MTRHIVYDAKKLNAYQRGRVSGIAFVLSGAPEKTLGWSEDERGIVLTQMLDCTDEQYKQIVSMVNRQYPGCVIGVDKENSDWGTW